MECVFCKIAKREITADVLFEDDDIIAFYDVHPMTPVHVLVIPKKHVESVNAFEDSDAALVGKMVLTAKRLAMSLRIPGIATKITVGEKGYKLLIRTGEHGGQEVPHVHLHLLGGGELHEKIYVV